MENKPVSYTHLKEFGCEFGRGFYLIRWGFFYKKFACGSGNVIWISFPNTCLLYTSILVLHSVSVRSAH